MVHFRVSHLCVNRIFYRVGVWRSPHLSTLVGEKVSDNREVAFALENRTLTFETLEQEFWFNHRREHPWMFLEPDDSPDELNSFEDRYFYAHSRIGRK